MTDREGSARYSFLPKDMYDHDIGSLNKLEVNENYGHFNVKKPMKNSTYITYEVTGLRVDTSKPFVLGQSSVDPFAA
jgi:hypothetical protein